MNTHIILSSTYLTNKSFEIKITVTFVVASGKTVHLSVLSFVKTQDVYDKCGVCSKGERTCRFDLKLWCTANEVWTCFQ